MEKTGRPTSFPLALFFPSLCLIPFRASVLAILTCCLACSAVSLICLMIAVLVSAVGLPVHLSRVRFLLQSRGYTGDGTAWTDLETGIRRLSLSCLIGLIPGKLAFWMAESICFKC